MKMSTHKQHRHIKALLLMACLSVFTAVVSQPAVSIGNMAVCAENEWLVSVQVDNFLDVAAFTFYIGLDTNQVKVLGVENVHPRIASGNLLSNLQTSGDEPHYTLSWFGASAADIQQDVLFGLRLLLKTEQAALVFSPDCEIVLNDLSIVDDVIYTNGLLTDFSALTPEPGILQMDEGASAALILPAQDELAYQWQVKTEGQWTDLQNGTHFNGVETAELQLINISKAYNDNLFRCVLQANGCEKETQTAKLEVSTLGMNESHAKPPILQISPNPLYGQLRIIASKTVEEPRFTITDMQGRLQWQAYPGRLDIGASLYLATESLPPGSYVLQMFDDRQWLAAEKLVKLNNR